MKKSINVLSVLVLLFVCPMAQPATATSDQTGTIQYAGKSTQISIGEIGKDDKGNTTVQVFMNFGMLVQGSKTNAAGTGAFAALIDAASRAPLTALQAAFQTIRAKIVAQNKTFEASDFSMNADGLKMTASADRGTLVNIGHVIYHFDTAASPEKIMVYTGQDPGLTFNGETKEIIK
jgi:hypothetical protein